MDDITKKLLFTNQASNIGYNNIDSNNDKAIIGKFASVMAYISAAYGVNYLIRRIPTGIQRERLRFLQGFVINKQPWYRSVTNLTSTASVQELIWNFTKGFEETLFNIPRSLSISALYGSGILSQQQLYIPGESLAGQEKYLKYISSGEITEQHFAQGFLYKGNKLYDASGQKVLLQNARIIPGIWEGEHTPRIIKSVYSQRYASIPKSELYIVGGQRRFAAFSELGHAWGTQIVENYMRLLDNPLELLSVFLENIGKGNTFIARGIRTFNENVVSKLPIINKFGVGGEAFMRGGISALLKRHVTRGLPMLLMAGVGVKLLNDLVRKTTGTSILGVGAKIYQNVSLTASKISEITGLTELSKKQEEAGGPTSFMQLASIPLAGAIFGATIGKIAELTSRGPVKEAHRLPEFITEGIYAARMRQGIIGKLARNIDVKSIGRVGLLAAAGAAIGTLTILPFIPGVLGTSKKPEELEEIYRGERLVPIRKNRFWELGNTPWEGEETKYHLPHWTVRAISDARAKAIYKDYYGKPLSRLIAFIEDKYYLERMHDKERPYVYWGPSDHGLGFIEKIASPIARIFKPIKLAHPEAFENEAIIKSKLMGYAPPPPSGISTGDTISTYDYIPHIQTPGNLTQYSKDAWRAITVMGGLHGFVLDTMLKRITGDETPTPNIEWATSGQITSMQRRIQDEQLGGFAGVGEAIRRLSISEPYENIKVAAPIRNTMPTWLPKRFQYGDPYAQIEAGEYRLPGAGYESLHPELQGVDPENYPYVHRLAILNNVAPYSLEYYRTKNLVERQIVEGDLNTAGISMYKEVMREREEKERGKEFATSGKSMLGDYWLAIKKIARSLPTESLYPFSPAHKFAGPVDAYTEFRDLVILDKTYKLWSRPLQDFIVPALNKTFNIITFGKYIPKEAIERQQIETYFDLLQSHKNQILENKAIAAWQNGKYEIADYYRQMKRRALHGLELSEDLDLIKQALPQRYRTYLEPLINIADTTIREKILYNVPPEIQQVLVSRWTHDLSGEINALPPDTLLEQITPPRDWTGYAPGVDLNAVKVQTLVNLGKNIREYNLFNREQLHAEAYAKIAGLPPPSTEEEITSNVQMGVNRYLNTYGISSANTTLIPSVDYNSKVDIYVKKDDSKEIRTHLKDMGLIGY